MLTVFMAGVVAFVTATCAEIGGKAAESQWLRPIRAQWKNICAWAMIRGENAVAVLRNFIRDSDMAWGSGQKERLRLEEKMLPPLSKSRAICRHSGILLDADQLALEAVLNGKAYRGSG